MNLCPSRNPGASKSEQCSPLALGCNLAWGLVDAVMYLVRTATDRGRSLTLVRSVRAADAEAGCRLVANSLSRKLVGLVSSAEIEAVRGRIVALFAT
jgi:hypothetical protein